MHIYIYIKVLMRHKDLLAIYNSDSVVLFFYFILKFFKTILTDHGEGPVQVHVD